MADRLSKRLLYTFGTADMLFGVMISMEAYFFPAFLTDYAQFSLMLVGQILWFTSAIDIVCALAGGLVLQRVTLKFGGKYRSWFLLGPPIFAALYILQFTKLGDEWTAVSLIMLGFVTSHLLFNVVFAASGAMVGRLSQRNDERTVLSASRAQGMTASALIFSLTALPMVAFFGARLNKIAGFTATVAVYAVLMILGYLYVYWITAGRDPYDEIAIDSAGKRTSPSTLETFRLVARNPPLLLLLVAEIFRNASIFIITAFAFYYFEYVHKNLDFVSVFILVLGIAGFLGSSIAAWVGNKMGKRHSYWIFCVIAASGYALAKFTGGTPWTFTIVLCSASIFGAIPGALCTALFSDTVVYGEWKTGQNTRAFIMGLGNLPIKFSLLIRSGVLSIGLVKIGFVAKAVPTPGVMDGITSFITYVPAVTSLIAAIIFYCGYNLEDKRIFEMQSEIDSRKAPVTA